MVKRQNFGHEKRSKTGNVLIQGKFEILNERTKFQIRETKPEWGKSFSRLMDCGSEFFEQN
jgi:hypothetical protein